MSVRKIILFCLFCLSFSRTNAVVKGSETVVSIEPAATFPAADNNNQMLAFGWFKNGFTLEDATTTCTFGSMYPVCGDVHLNGGKLYLDTDLHFSNNSQLLSFGKIYGTANASILEFDTNVTTFADPDNIGLLEDIDLVTNADVALTGTLRFVGNCTFNGKGRRVTFDPGSVVSVGHNSTLTIKDATFLGVATTKLDCLDDTGKIILDNVTLILDANYRFSSGGLEVINNADVLGTYTFFYDGTQTLTIHPYSSLNIGGESSIYVGNQEGTNNPQVISFLDKTSKFSLENCSIVVGPAGMNITHGSLAIGGSVVVDIHSTNTGNGIHFGNGTDYGDMTIICQPASMLTFNNGHIVFDMLNPNTVQAKSTYTKMIRGPNCTFYVKQDIRYADVSIVVDVNAALIVAAGKNVFYDNTKISMDPVKFIIKGSRYNTYTTLLNGDEWVFLQEGIFPLYLLVKNAGNTIDGNGSVSGQIILYDSNAELTLNLAGQFLNNITLGGSKLILAGDTELGHNVMIKGAGTINLDRNDLTLGTKDLNWTSTIYWDGTYGAVDMNADLSLYSTWTFSGDCVLKGNGNTLYLEQAAQINVERGSSLTLKNVHIKKAHGTNIHCLDGAASLWFDHVLCFLSDDFYFNNGFFVVDHCFELDGGYGFYYQSDQQSSVARGGHFEIKPGGLLSYAPASSARNLILLETDDSELMLDGATLHSTTTGLQLTTGMLSIVGNCFITSDATCKAEGIIFGEGVSAGNDLMVQIPPESNLKITSGHLVYKNLT